MILSSLQLGVLLVNEEDRVEFANQAFCDMFDLKYAPEDLYGLIKNEVIQKIRVAYANPAEAVTRLEEIVAQYTLVTNEEVAMTRGRTHLRHFVPIVIDGNRYGRLGHAQDITELKKSGEALARALAKAEELRYEAEVIGDNYT
jgi:sensor histidine kinase regulating citrate/malate metabolism